MKRSENKIAIGVDEAAKRVSLGRSFVWSEVWSGKLVSYRIGRRRLIRVADLEKWLRSNKAAPRRSAEPVRS
jgi:excisionase family DNA binding protein